MDACRCIDLDVLHPKCSRKQVKYIFETPDPIIYTI